VVEALTAFVKVHQELLNTVSVRVGSCDMVRTAL
jgi:hypothetical protein